MKEKERPVTRKTPAKMKAKEKTEEPPAKKKLSGWVDDEGARHLDEVDLLKLNNSHLRIKNLRFQAEVNKTKSENVRMELETKRLQYLRQADAFDRAARDREHNYHRNMIKEMGARYGVEFDDPNIVIDDESGKIKFIVPPE